MMERNNHKDSSQRWALAISICLHALLLLGAYYLRLGQLTGFSSGYSITLDPAWSHQEAVSEDRKSNSLPPHQLANASEDIPTAQTLIKNQRAEKPIPAETVKAKIPVNTVPELQEGTGEGIATDQIENSAQDPSEASIAINQEEAAAETIDGRGLYKVHQGKQTGALLELAGWMWDAAPQPQDNTNEVGKIIFQITIDELGEVIAVKTLEKTISPVVEKIYKESLTTLTFSKTTDNIVYAPTSTGKVTFILQVE